MASKKEIEEHLKIALNEIGEIKPWFDKEVDAWVFSHKAYPVEYAGDSKKEVIKNYPLYLREFIKQRLNDNLAPNIEKRTKGQRGQRKNPQDAFPFVTKQSEENCRGCFECQQSL